jgi:hypothetical protein
MLRMQSQPGDGIAENRHATRGMCLPTQHNGMRLVMLLPPCSLGQVLDSACTSLHSEQQAPLRPVQSCAHGMAVPTAPPWA